MIQKKGNKLECPWLVHIRANLIHLDHTPLDLIHLDSFLKWVAKHSSPIQQKLTDWSAGPAGQRAVYHCNKYQWVSSTNLDYVCSYGQSLLPVLIQQSNWHKLTSLSETRLYDNDKIRSHIGAFPLPDFGYTGASTLAVELHKKLNYNSDQIQRQHI